VRRTPNQSESDVAFSRSCDQEKSTKKDWKIIADVNWCSEPNFQTVLFQLAWFIWPFDASLVYRFVIWYGNLGCALIDLQSYTCDCYRCIISNFVTGSSGGFIITAHTSPNLFCPSVVLHTTVTHYKPKVFLCVSCAFSILASFQLSTLGVHHPSRTPLHCATAIRRVIRAAWCFCSCEHGRPQEGAKWAFAPPGNWF